MWYNNNVKREETKMTDTYEIKHINNTWYVFVNGKVHAGFTTKRMARHCIDTLKNENR